jgi:hemerythrin superfamily protein
MNAVTLLTNDHRTVEGLVERYRSATDEAKQALLDQITRELMKHMDAEEGPLRTSILDGEKLTADALAEHNKAKELLAEL